MTENFEHLVQKITPQGKLLSTWRMTGGVSAQVTALEVESAGGTKKLIVLEHGEADRKRNPQIAADEFRLLQQLKSAGLATPTPLYVDHTIFPAPVIVIEYIEGTTDFIDANLPEFAAYLASIHRVRVEDFAFLPQQADLFFDKIQNRPSELDTSLDEGRIRDTLEAVGQIPQTNASVLLHGDYWQGNVVWQDGQLMGIIDWEDAARGDPLADLANTRLEMLWAFGVEGMQHFTDLYYAQMPHVDLKNLAYWDLYTALRPAFRLSEWAVDDAVREQKMREGHHQFVRQAFESLSG